jgi:gamma-glutamyltranspeptidase/glutathione hydrolase
MEKMLDAHGNSTIYLSTIDKDGNIVSLIQSNFAGYGTGMVAPGLGFSFHNRGAGF